jgi:DNA primase
MDDYALRGEARDRVRASDLISMYIEQFGNNQLAVWNALTDYASQEQNLRVRNENLMRVGKYLSKEIKKMLKSRQDALSESLSWNEMIFKIN